MQLVRSDSRELTLTGNIKSTDDYLAIRKAVTGILDEGGTAVTLKIRESLSMPSSVIGFFVKLVNRDKVKISMQIQDPRLLELLDELGLKEAFGAHQG